MYRLTEAGLEELRLWISRLVERWPARDELLLKLLFGRPAGPAHLRATVKRMRAERGTVPEERGSRTSRTG